MIKTTEQLIEELTSAAKKQADGLCIPILSTLQGKAARVLDQTQKELDKATGVLGVIVSVSTDERVKKMALDFLNEKPISETIKKL